MTMIKLILPLGMLMLAAAVASGCGLNPTSTSHPKEPEILTIYPDGSMKLMGKPISEEDVVIYPDGYGGEKAAVKVRIEPLHPDFYRDTIIVKRINPEDPGTTDQRP
jgi:hypothetical protein